MLQVWGMACCWDASGINTGSISRDENQRYKKQAEVITPDLSGGIRTHYRTQEATIEEVPRNCDRLRNPVSITEFYSLSIKGEYSLYEAVPLNFLRKENFSITPAIISVLFIYFLCGNSFWSLP